MLARKSDSYFVFTGILLVLLGFMFVHASLQQGMNGPFLREKGEWVKRLELTDLCLFTDARYTRHPSMADLNTPFQDYPLSFEHFPSGSMINPPPHLRKSASEE